MTYHLVCTKTGGLWREYGGNADKQKAYAILNDALHEGYRRQNVCIATSPSATDKDAEWTLKQLNKKGPGK